MPRARPPRSLLPPSRRRAGPRSAAVALGLLVALVLAGCGLVSTASPEPTPADFPGFVTDLAAEGIRVGEIVSGDAGCDDAALTPTAIRFTATGLDQADPVELRIFIFRNADAYQRLRSSVDACLAEISGAGELPTAFDASPFVLSGTGAWGPDFTAALRRALIKAAGTGG